MEKRLLLSLLIIPFLLTGCFTSQQYREVAHVGDFRRFIVNDFIVSTVATGYTFTPVAEIDIEFMIGSYDINQAKERVKKYGIFNVGTTLYGNFYPSYDYMLALLVDKAKELGANGILNFKITKNDTNTRYVASGFAVNIPLQQPAVDTLTTNVK